MRSQRTERGEGQAEVGKDRKARPLWERARPTKSWQKRVYIYIDIYVYKELTAQLGQSALESAAKSAKWREGGWDEGELPQNWRVSVNNAFIAFFCNCVRVCVWACNPQRQLAHLLMDYSKVQQKTSAALCCMNGHGRRLRVKGLLEAARRLAICCCICPLPVASCKLHH